MVSRTVLDTKTCAQWGTEVASAPPIVALCSPPFTTTTTATMQPSVKTIRHTYFYFYLCVSLSIKGCRGLLGGEKKNSTHLKAKMMGEGGGRKEQW